MHHNKIKITREVHPGFTSTIGAVVRFVSPTKTTDMVMNRKERRANHIKKGET